MAESYVPQNTTVVCTNMTVSTPQMIKIVSPRNVIYTTNTQPFLTEWDNKLSGSFQCKSPGKFWGGLQALALGVAIGAAVVLTGGAAAVVVIVASAVSIGSGAIGLYKMAHDCDATLQEKWKEVHGKVRFNKQYALLNRSFLDCPKKGKITIIMDPVIAQKAADFISNNNNKEGMMQMGSQFVMGAISGITAGVTVAGVAISGALTLALYWPSEAFGDTRFGSENETAASIISGVGGDAVSAGVGAGTKAIGITSEVGGALINSNVGNTVSGLAQYGTGVATGNVSKSLEGALRNYVGHQGLKANNYAGYKGLAGFIANIAIGAWSDTYENNLAKETKDMAEKFKKSDKNNGISVIATEV